MEEQKKNPAQGLSESEQVQVRRQKLADLQAAGNDPFTLTKFPQDAYLLCRSEGRVCRPAQRDRQRQDRGAGWPYDVQARNGQGKLCPPAGR